MYSDISIYVHTYLHIVCEYFYVCIRIFIDIYVYIHKGRPVVIDFETGAPKKSFRKPDGKVWTKQDSEFKKKIH
jgi:hypothetical protein